MHDQQRNPSITPSIGNTHRHDNRKDDYHNTVETSNDQTPNQYVTQIPKRLCAQITYDAQNELMFL